MEHGDSNETTNTGSPVAEGAMLALPPPPADLSTVDLTPLSHATASPTLPLSVGVQVADGVCEIMLQRGSTLPATATRLFTTANDNQLAAGIAIYVGERPFCHGNRFVGAFMLSPLPTPSYRSFVQIEITITVQNDGVLSCEAAEIEGRALGEDYCHEKFSGNMLEPSIETWTHDVASDIAVFSHTLAKHLPVLLATRTIRLANGKDVVIRQHQRREEERIGTGGVLWESAIVLADYVVRNSNQFNWRGKRVLELGAGTGLVAIALAMEGANVTATDGNPKVLVGAQKNIETAGFRHGEVKTETFDWNSVDDLQRVHAAGPWDAIVGSDLVYPGNAGRRCVASNEQKPPADESLLSLLKVLSQDQTLVILALKDRTGEVARFISLASEAQRGCILERAPSDSLMPEFSTAPAFAVLHLHLHGSTGLQQ